MFHEFDGEPIEQRLVGGPFAEAAEVIDAGDNALAEVPAPDAVGHHAAGEGVAGLSHPLGELQAAAFLGSDGGLVVTGDDPKEAPGDGRAEGPMAAAGVDGSIGNFAVDNAHGLGKIRCRLFEALGFGLHDGDLFANGSGIIAAGVVGGAEGAEFLGEEFEEGLDGGVSGRFTFFESLLEE